MPFTVVTCTGDRPEAFEICKWMMAKQTQKPTQWIIVDDGHTPIQPPTESYVQYVRRIRDPKEGHYTIVAQFKTALEYVGWDHVIVMEDDDWYSHLYLETMRSFLDKAQLVGNSHNVYYFMRDAKYFVHENTKHSSLCSTAFRRDMFKTVLSVHSTQVFLDLKLWNCRKCTKHLATPDPLLVLGIKQLPGRTGPTHEANRTILRAGLRDDSNGHYFHRVVGEDFQLYTPYLGGDVHA